MATIAQPAGASGAEAASARAKLSPAQMFEQARVCEIALSRLVMAYISAGIVFLLLPGTFLGVWNLIQISGRASVAAISPVWIQAHGHAQVFGWIGSFILGIGFYSVPKLRGTAKKEVTLAWACWAMWTLGVALRWFTTAYGWKWHALMPSSALLEFIAFAIFFSVVSQHRPEATTGKRGLDPWVWVVISGAIGLFLMLTLNLGASVYLALRGASPALPHGFDQRYLVLIGWGFLAPFVWGFNAKWLPVFLGLQPTRAKLLLAAVALKYAGIILTFGGQGTLAPVLFVACTLLAIAALRVFEPSRQEAKTRGVHVSFPFFVRLSYGWLLVASLLGVAASQWDVSGGIWGATRHSFTVGFVAVMVFCVGQRVLPAFAGMRLLWSTRLMFAGLLLPRVGDSGALGRDGIRDEFARDIHPRTEPHSEATSDCARPEYDFVTNLPGLPT
jgi:uncharacterized protein involved in response to NO